MIARLVGISALLIALAAPGMAAAQPCGDPFVVRPGETTESIARRCGVDPRALYDANPGLERYGPRPGDRLRIPYAPANVEMYVRPDAGPPGSTVTVIADGLRPNERVDIGVLDRGERFRRLARGRADARGHVAVDIVVPEDRDGDGRMRFAVATRNGAVLARSERFEVVYDRGWRGPGGGPPISLTGVVTHEGRFCPTVRDRDGNLFSLAEQGEPFRPGDIVAVEGRVAGRSRCDQGTSVHVFSIRKIGEARADARPGSVEQMLGTILNQMTRPR